MNKDLVLEQRKLIRDIDFGGLLDIAATSMTGDLSQWILKHYEAEISQIVIPDRGKITVDSASVMFTSFLFLVSAFEFSVVVLPLSFLNLCFWT